MSNLPLIAPNSHRSIEHASREELASDATPHEILLSSLAHQPQPRLDIARYPCWLTLQKM